MLIMINHRWIAGGMVAVSLVVGIFSSLPRHSEHPVTETATQSKKVEPAKPSRTSLEKSRSFGAPSLSLPSATPPALPQTDPLGLAWKSVDSGNIEEAVRWFDLEAQQSPEHLYVRLESLRLKIDQLGQLEEVVGDIVQLARESEAGDDIKMMALDWLWEAEEFQDALVTLESIAQIDTETKVKKAGILHDLGDHEGAVRVLREAHDELAAKGTSSPEIEGWLAKETSNEWP